MWNNPYISIVLYSKDKQVRDRHTACSLDYRYIYNKNNIAFHKMFGGCRINWCKSEAQLLQPLMFLICGSVYAKCSMWYCWIKIVSQTIWNTVQIFEKLFYYPRIWNSQRALETHGWILLGYAGVWLPLPTPAKLRRCFEMLHSC